MREHPEVSEEEGGGNHKRHGAGDLGDGERGTQGAADGWSAAAATGIEHRSKAQAEGVQNRRQAEGAAGQNRDAARKQEDAPAQMRLHETRRVRRQCELQDRQQLRGNEHTRSAPQ